MNPLNTALTQIRRSPYQSLSAILLLSLTFFVAYLFSSLMIGSEIVLRYFESRPQVIAFFQIQADTTQVEKVLEQMKSKDYVTQVKLVSKEEALQIYQQENKGDPLLLELVTAEILPASIEVSGKSIGDLKQIKADLDQFEQIDEVVLQQDIIDSLGNWTKILRITGISSIGVLATLSFLMMMIVIGMKAVAKRPAIAIMHLIGATRWFIQSPFVFEGIVYAVVSSLLGFVLATALLLYATPYLQNFLGEVATQLFPLSPAFLAIQLSVGSLLGILVGAVAGGLAVGRMIKR